MCENCLFWKNWSILVLYVNKVQINVILSLNVLKCELYTHADEFELN